MKKIELQLIQSISRMVDQRFKTHLKELCEYVSLDLSNSVILKALDNEICSVKNICCKHMYDKSFTQLINFINYRCELFYNSMIQA